VPVASYMSRTIEKQWEQSESSTNSRHPEFGSKVGQMVGKILRHASGLHASGLHAKELQRQEVGEHSDCF
jgi:hypothetical protein